MLINSRWQKVWSDLWRNKSRTLLVVLSIAVGLFALGVIINAQAILSRELAREFAAVKPASATLTTGRPFDEDLVKTIRNLRTVQEAEGRYKVTVRLQVGPESGHWRDFDLWAIDYDDMRLNLIQPESGAWPPPQAAVLLERSTLDLEGMEAVQIGDLLPIETGDDLERELRVAGVVHDLTLTPSPGTGRAYGYISLETLEWLGEPRDFNQLSFVVAGDPLDEAQIWEVVQQVKHKIELNGWTVERVAVPPPGEHPLNSIIAAVLFLLGALGALSLLASGFLVVNTISGLLAQQIRQIGLMKALGARSGQLITMYLGMALIFGLLALLISIPLGIAGARLFSNFMANRLNFDLTNPEVPPSALVWQAVVGLLIPFLAALYPILWGSRITVREALGSYGLSQGQVKSGWFDGWLERFAGRSRPLLLSLRNTFRQRGRLAFTLTTLILSGALFMAILSVRASLYYTLDNGWLYRQYNLWVTLNRPYRAERLERAAQAVSGVMAAEGFGFNPGVRRLRPDGRESDDFSLVALPPETSMFQKPPLQQGRWLRPDDQNAAVISTTLLEDEPDLKVGDELILKIEDQETTWQIVGIAEVIFMPPGLYVNYPYFSRLVGEVGQTAGLWVAVQPDEPGLEAQVAASLEQQYQATNLRVRSLDTRTDQRWFAEFHFEIITVLLLVMATLLAFVGGLGLMGTMSLNVIERTREIGVMRAIGASNRTIQHLVIGEGLLIGLLSWLIAIVVAFPLGQLLSSLVGGLAFLNMRVSYTFALSSVLLWLFLVLVLATVASFLPARNASRLAVREVLAYE